MLRRGSQDLRGHRPLSWHLFMCRRLTRLQGGPSSVPGSGGSREGLGLEDQLIILNLLLGSGPTCGS